MLNNDSLGRALARPLLRPWERHLPQWCKEGVGRLSRPLSPTLVQPNFHQIIGQMGTPARPLNPGEIPADGPQGTRLPRRQRLSVVRKGHSRA